MSTTHVHRGLTLIELLLVCAFIAVLAGAAIPSLLTSRKAANESAAIAGLRSIVTAEKIYHRRAGTAYTGLRGLSGLVDPAIATGSRCGYTYAAAGPATPGSFAFTADPGLNAGDRHFYVDQTGVIRASRKGPASARDNPIP